MNIQAIYTSNQSDGWCFMRTWPSGIWSAENWEIPIMYPKIDIYLNDTIKRQQGSFYVNDGGTQFAVGVQSEAIPSGAVIKLKVDDFYYI